MSDEAHFTLSRTVKKQNYRSSGTENPQIIHEVPFYGQKVTVWCGDCADMMIEAGETVTCNQKRYRDMISDFLMPIVHGNGME